ncbi:MAG: cupin, partial [Leptolyngbyaceae cyanobacterium]
RVRQLVTNSYWLQTQLPTLEQHNDVAIATLYDEIGYPLTVQNVVAKPTMVSPIHNHGTWGVIYILKGQERHTFWRRVDEDQQSFHIEATEEKTFGPGEIVSFMPQAIHQVSNPENMPTLTFQLYGDTQPASRYEFQPDQATAKPF